MDRVFFALGPPSAFLGVTAGALGAHALKSRLAPDILAVFEVAMRYRTLALTGIDPGVRSPS